MALKFKCDVCGIYHHAYTCHFSLGKVCTRCASVVTQGSPLELAVKVRRALAVLERLTYAYRVLREGGGPIVTGLALRAKTRGLIRHDRILRGEG